jgi:hypothetical protein
MAGEFDYYENWAKPGGGNSFIFYSLVECIKRKKIDSSDTVAIMWTSIGREDRYLFRKGWVTPGSIYNQQVYDQNFVTKLADPFGYLIRDLAHLSATRRLLDSIGCTYHFFASVPMLLFDDNTDMMLDLDRSIIDVYKDDLALVKPSVYEVIFNKNWYSRKGPIDLTQVEHDYNSIKGLQWPTWEKFVLQEWDDTPKQIKKEITEEHNFLNKLLIRSDTHPTTDEHYEYLTKVFGKIEYKYVSSSKVTRF